MKKEIKVIIVDDEKLARDLIKHYLQKFINIKVLAESSNALEAVKQINELKPDLIFLDIQMPKINGFELLEIIDYKPYVIFSTAYDEYAIKAFEVNAVDYLLKPYSQERFDKAVNKIISMIEIEDKNLSVENFSNFSKLSLNKIDKVIIKKNNEILIIPISEIYFIEAQDDYVNISSSKGSFLKYKTLKFYEENLPKENFIRVHRSFIINLNNLKKVEQYEKGNYIALMKNDSKIPISRTGFEKLKEYFN